MKADLYIALYAFDNNSGVLNSGFTTFFNGSSI